MNPIDIGIDITDVLRINDKVRQSFVNHLDVQVDESVFKIISSSEVSMFAHC